MGMKNVRVSIARSPMRDKASHNLQERLYQRLMRPMPGLREPESREWNFIFAFPGMTVNLYPDQIDFWLNYPIDERRTCGLWPAHADRDADSQRDDVLHRAAQLAASHVGIGVRPEVAGMAGLLQPLGLGFRAREQ